MSLDTRRCEIFVAISEITDTDSNLRDCCENFPISVVLIINSHADKNVLPKEQLKGVA
jgi:hypothetical protein